MRTGSVGNRSAEDMVRTLPAEKKLAISEIRKELLDKGYLEEVEYDQINIEPVLIYSRSEKQVVFLRHKWETSASIPLRNLDDQEKNEAELEKKFGGVIVSDENENRFLKFTLPEHCSDFLIVLGKISSAADSKI
jgi:hypothetical protein